MLFVPLTYPFGKICKSQPVLQYNKNVPQFDGYIYALFLLFLSRLNLTTLCDETAFRGLLWLASILLSKSFRISPIGFFPELSSSLELFSWRPVCKCAAVLPDRMIKPTYQ